ncbi:hypothetical protein IMZ48_42745 [Candidatus Bathyarchaeota archaeon]|nr:hypothetical protein [Candidatus Bathyarchaeota archaeon]
MPQSGTCRNSCGVFIRGGPQCRFTGNHMWEDYQNIRKAGCEQCGFKRYDDGCEVVVDYVTMC